jgi:hypothetical protein
VAVKFVATATRITSAVALDVAQAEKMHAEPTARRTVLIHDLERCNGSAAIYIRTYRRIYFAGELPVIGARPTAAMGTLFASH